METFNFVKELNKLVTDTSKLESSVNRRMRRREELHAEMLQLKEDIENGLEITLPVLCKISQMRRELFELTRDSLKDGEKLLELTERRKAIEVFIGIGVSNN